MVAVAVLVIAVAVAVALRWWTLTSIVGRADSDETVVGLMARGILHGQHPVFFWGQAYGGSIEPALVAAVFRVAGTSTAALKAVPMMLAVAGAVLLWRVARRTADPGSAPFAAALALVYPPAFVWWSTKERGFYWVALVCVVAAMLVALRLDTRRDAPALRDLVAFGAIFGASWWTSPQTMFVILPVTGWLAVRARRSLARYWPVIPAAVVGALPWIAYNLRHNLASLRQPAAAVPSTYGDRLHLFFARLLPTTVGVRRPFTGTWLFGPVVGVVCYLAVLGALVALVVWALRARTPYGALFATIVVAYPFLFAVPSTSYHVTEPRYGLMLAPVLVLLVTSVVRARPLAQLVAIVVASALAFATVAFTLDVARTNPYSVDLDPPRVTPLVTTLDHAGVRAVFADYWIAYPLTFATRERIAGSPVDAVRSASIAARAAAPPRSTYVVFRDHPRDTALLHALQRRHIPFRHVDTGLYSVYFLDRRVTPDMFSGVWALPSP